MKTLYLLDTNIIVFLLRGQMGIRDSIERIGIDQCHISEITYAELLYGAECSHAPRLQLEHADTLL